jgi:hypothetical protein
MEEKYTHENYQDWMPMPAEKFIEEYDKKIRAVKPWDLLNPEAYTTESVANERLEICRQCPEFIALTSQCKKCGCFMAFKTKLSEATCPLNKW